MPTVSRSSKPRLTRRLRVRLTILCTGVLAVLFLVTYFQMRSLESVAQEQSSNEALDQAQAALTMALQSDARFAQQALAHWHATGELIQKLDPNWVVSISSRPSETQRKTNFAFEPEFSVSVGGEAPTVGYEVRRLSNQEIQTLAVTRRLSPESLGQWIHRPELDLAIIVKTPDGQWVPAVSSYSANRLPSVELAVRAWQQAAQWQGMIYFPDGPLGFRSLPLSSAKQDAVVLFTERSELTKDILASINQRLLVIGLVSLLLLPALMFMLGSTLIKPILRLVRSTDAIARGELDQEITLDRDDELGVLSQSVETMRSNLKQRAVEMQRLVDVDMLTGVLSRRAFEERLTTCLTRHKRLAVLLIDLDHFKQVNDRHGHSAGDVVLRTIARRLVRQIGAAGYVGRMGGDEFGIILPEADAQQATDLSLALMPFLNATITANLSDKRVALHVGASIGQADTIKDQVHDPLQLLHLADRRMYNTKQVNRQVALFASARQQDLENSAAKQRRMEALINS